MINLQGIQSKQFRHDPDTLRSDPVFKLIADRLPDDPDLASQPTLSRFENAIDIPSLKRLREQFVDQFIASFVAPPCRLTFDMDAVDDPTYGAQQLTLLHGYFEQYQYFSSFITSADNDQVVVLALQHGNAFVADLREANIEQFESVHDGRHHEAANAVVRDRVIIELEFAQVA